jgi:hypothetical protein
MIQIRSMTMEWRFNRKKNTSFPCASCICLCCILSSTSSLHAIQSVFVLYPRTHQLSELERVFPKRSYRCMHARLLQSFNFDGSHRLDELAVIDEFICGFGVLLF